MKVASLKQGRKHERVLVLFKHVLCSIRYDRFLIVHSSQSTIHSPQSMFYTDWKPTILGHVSQQVACYISMPDDTHLFTKTRTIRVLPKI